MRVIRWALMVWIRFVLLVYFHATRRRWARWELERELEMDILGSWFKVDEE